ncbi:hypothetical protein BN406_06649 (plasmid) [Sinorhizobium meliloti Rm41]|nr:hypothetical protein BN406_06649 [Sinorhizobium meliloti Rm41]
MRTFVIVSIRLFMQQETVRQSGIPLRAIVYRAGRLIRNSQVDAHLQSLPDKATAGAVEAKCRTLGAATASEPCNLLRRYRALSSSVIPRLSAENRVIHPVEPGTRKGNCKQHYQGLRRKLPFVSPSKHNYFLYRHIGIAEWYLSRQTRNRRLSHEVLPLNAELEPSHRGYKSPRNNRIQQYYPPGARNCNMPDQASAAVSSAPAVCSSVTKVVGFIVLIEARSAASFSAPPEIRTRSGVRRRRSMLTEMTRELTS